jgi:hypothetical protein
MSEELRSLKPGAVPPLSFAAACRVMDRVTPAQASEVATHLDAWLDRDRAIYIDAAHGELAVAPAALRAYAALPSWTAVRSVVVQGARAGEVAEGLAQVNTRELTTLVVGAGGDDTLLDLLAEADRFPRLRELALGISPRVNDAAVARFAAGPAAQRLEHLTLSRRPSASLLHALFSHGRWSSLRSLGFWVDDVAALQTLNERLPPGLTNLELTLSKADCIAALDTSPALAQRVGSLFTFLLPPAAVSALVANPHLHHLQSLSIQQSTLALDALTALESCAFRDRLEAFALLACSLSDDDDWALLPALSLPRLAALQLVNLRPGECVSPRRMDAPDANTTVASDLLRRLDLPVLESLALIDTLIQDDVEVLAHEQWPRLTHLTLHNNPLGDDGLALLARWSMALLRSLDISCLDASPQGVARLSTLHLPVLESLNLARNSLDPSTAAALARTVGQSVGMLNLTNTGLTDETLARLFPGDCWPRLSALSLAGNAGLSARGLESLFTQALPFHLLSCDLSRLVLDRVALQALTNSPSLSRLVHLNLAGCQLPLEAADLLVSSPLVARLDKLDLSTPLPAASLDKIRQTNPCLGARLTAPQIFDG